MGYESKIYVVEKSRHSWRDDGMVYGSVVAMVDMCKCYPLSDYLRRSPATNCYIYADDGDTEITEDRYGQALTETSIADTIEHLEKVMVSDYYWRYDLLLSVLKEVNEYDGRIVVLHYGY
jgi:hypothetical protein